ncbi:hypothetical protein EV126DRAFT_409190 [Verticillium dahliae]|nr:hypothetical protein EV126DRAFT_409190 [Verticillium dahliae]
MSLGDVLEDRQDGHFCSKESLNLREFFSKYAFEYLVVLEALKLAGAVVSGPEVVMFATGRWSDSLRERPRALVLDILYCGEKPRRLLEMLMSQSGYKMNHYSCRHELGEWSNCAKDHVRCFVRGDLAQRVVHLVEVRAPPLEVILSRVYGSAVGTYITGSMRLVSLFPTITFKEKRIWMPTRTSKVELLKVERKYVELKRWSSGSNSEVMGSRRLSDKRTWRVTFGEDGVVLSSIEPPEEEARTDVDECRSEGMGLCFPSMRPLLNSGGNVFPADIWKW